MPDYEQVPLVGKHLNRGLFADYYLNEMVPALPEWDSELFQAGKQALAQIKTLRTGLQPETLDEPQLEERWIQPVLRLLGHHYAVQGKLRYRDKGHRKPDYVFLASAAEAQSVTSQVYAVQEITHWLAVGDAKRWGARLDQAAPNERNPSQQIDEYLRYSERPWGILTDGRYWRLYHRDSSKHNQYYAVDLESLLEGDDVEAFLYFYAFFRLEAFTTGWLAKVLAGSEDFAERLTDKLENEVYDALELIAQGFLDYRRNHLKPDPATLRSIYEYSLVLLYRMLFVFYAESRDILPMDNAEYRDRLSMDSIKKAVANQLRFGQTLDVDSSTIYMRLSDLFFAIDSGNARMDVPPYNGRLFSDAEQVFLGKNGVGDAHLVPALDRLARVDDEMGRRVFVDYRDLEVRHLGSIYEKLLEYQLDIATQPLTLRGDVYAAAKPGDTIIKQPGQVYLRTGSNERKVTGSYYTPDYIVRFIVEKTLEPLLSAITARHATLDSEGVWHVTDSAALVHEVLELNVLDPATGSGHFVVDATAYIAEWLRGLTIRPADLGEEDELIYWKRQVASACIYAVDLNPLAVELAKLSMWLATLAKGKPLSFLDHHIRVGNSLVGTNLVAIDDTALSPREEERRRKARARQRQQEAASGQMSMFSDADFSAGVGFAVQQMSSIENTIADKVSDVKQQEQWYAELTARLGMWRQAADVWTARYFGLELTPEQWKAVRTFTTNGVTPAALQQIISKASALAAEHHFFHWELMFPEIFFDQNGQPKATPGFDAVIGNPPYVRQERIQPIKPFLQGHYSVFSGTADLFLYFYELGIRFLKPEYRLGYVTSGTYMNSGSAEAFRKYVHEETAFDGFVDFGAIQPFRGADLPSVTIAILRKSQTKGVFKTLLLEGRRPPESLIAAMREHGFDTSPETTQRAEWRFQSVELNSLFQKLDARFESLSKASEFQIYRGVTTGLNDAFVIDAGTRQSLISEDPRSNEIIHALKRGDDLRPWYQAKNEEFLIFTRRGIDIEAYPAIKQHLLRFRSRLEPKPQNWNPKVDGTWKGRKAGSYQWFEIQDQTAYFQNFHVAKIVWGDISRFPRFSWNRNGSYLNNTGFLLSNAKLDLLAILQSRVSWFFISQIATVHDIRLGYWRYRVLPQFVERLPIPPLTADQESALAAIAEEITALAQQRYQLHEDMRLTMRNEFHGGDISSRVDLYRWWNIPDEQALSAEIRRQFGQEIPLRKRAEWRGFLGEQTAAHQTMTDQIIALETRMNEHVYDAFALTPEERALIERVTKYPYGEP
jgi:type I restriction-modification system DNA methylase subunit